ncbi:MAG: hypothetical protein K8S14_06070 [Actinomycetia bacterium]|nr:hypothetical protein [Actinomycetes bacterium]
MKKIVVFLIAILIALFILPLLLHATDLLPGDIAIIGMNSDNPDEFSFVSLIDIEQNTVIKFTDNGVHPDGSFRSTEGICTWTAGADISKGDIITYSSSGGFSATGGFALAAAGDQLIAYQGDEASPVFIYAIQTNSTQWQADATSAQTSALPPGLVNGVTAVAVGRTPSPTGEWDNSVYDMSVTNGTREEILAAIGDAGNWNGSNSRVGLPSDGSFSIEGGESIIEAPLTEPVWVRTMPMTCWQVWVNEDDMFEFVFWYPYKNNNWVRIYDMEGNSVFEADLLLNDPRLIVDLPDGMYTVKTFHDSEEPIQEFIIGKP